MKTPKLYSLIRDAERFKQSISELEKLVYRMQSPGAIYTESTSEICLCGHLSENHQNAFNDTGRSSFSCDCPRIFPAITVLNSYTDLFSNSTTGSGFHHALYIGILDVYRNMQSVKWREDLKCYACDKGVKEARFFVPMISDHRERDNFLLCAECARKVVE